MSLFHKNNERHPAKYSIEWIASLSNEKLTVEREIIRQEYCKSGYSKLVNSTEKNISQRRPSLETLLYLFDKEMVKRMNMQYELEHPEGTSPRHRDGGWYLPNDD